LTQPSISLNPPAQYACRRATRSAVAPVVAAVGAAVVTAAGFLNPNIGSF
jgi:hypothetical protein